MAVGGRHSGAALAHHGVQARQGCAVPWGAYAVWCLRGLTLAVALVTTWAYFQGGVTYLDNGDGLYLYPAQRLARGAVLYHDVMATQPPAVYLLGAAAFKAGLPVAGIRLLSAAMRAACIALVYVLGWRLFRDRLTAALASLLYALLPIGLAWDRSTNSNSPLTLLLLLSACALARDSTRSARLGGVLAALALFTKDLYVPVLAATLLYLLRQQRPLLASYVQGLLGGVIGATIVLLGYAGPTALRDVFLGQDASPLNPSWFIASVAYVVTSEGGLVLAALGGAWLCLRRPTVPGDNASVGGSYGAYLLLGSAAILVATLKEGTFGTVFQCAEPAVALLAAYALAWAARAFRAPSRVVAGRVAVGGALAALLTLSCASVIGTDRAALAMNNTGAVGRVASLVRRHAPPGSIVLEPPYYAVLTATRIPGDVSDTYIMDQRAQHGDARAMAWLHAIRLALWWARYPIVVADQHIAALPGIIPVLRRRYHPVYDDALPPSIHAVVWLPNGR